jgi:thiol-disulfide isomerase/thioredoxin
VDPVKVRKRLLIGSLAVSLVASVAIGWAIASSNDDSTADDELVVIDPTSGASFEPPSLGTNAAVEGDALPNLAVQNLEGQEVMTGDLIGQPLVINIWGSTCGPCKKELPDFAAAHAVFGDEVRFVGIDYLPPSDHEESFARDKGVQYELLYDASGDFINEMGISAFPVTLIVTPDGTIVEQTGQLDQEKLTALIEEHLL